MHFQYLKIHELPPLSWCAIVSQGSDCVEVYHGPRVETQDQFFVEGAWHGQYSRGEFDCATTFAGSGARLLRDRVVFVSPSHNLERNFSIRAASQFLVSNSLALLVTLSGEALDLAYSNYYFDFLRHYRTGLRDLNKTIDLASGRRIHFHDCQTVSVTRELQFTTALRSFVSAPASYHDVYNCHLEAVFAVTEHARDSAREFPCQLLSGISRGYDSTAVVVLGREAGLRETFAFRKSNAEEAVYMDDSGREIAEQLGLECTEYDRLGTADVDSETLAEHYVNPFFSSCISMNRLRDRLPGKLVLTGRHGEHFWGLDGIDTPPNLEQPSARGVPGSSSSEFRLAAGFFNFHVPYVAGIHARKQLAISHSDAMGPWRIGGDYDRPIPRRMVEDAGVARHQFGQVLLGGCNPDPQNRVLNESASEEFLAFCDENIPPGVRHRLVLERSGRYHYYQKGRAAGLDRWLRNQYGLRGIAEHVLGYRNHHRRDTLHLYTFHWCFSKLCRRYRAALDGVPGLAHSEGL